MSRLVEIAREIGKFELGVNEWRRFSKDLGMFSFAANAANLGFRYYILGGEVLAIANNENVLQTLGILAGAEAGKLAANYMFKGLGYVSGYFDRLNAIFIEDIRRK